MALAGRWGCGRLALRGGGAVMEQKSQGDHLGWRITPVTRSSWSHSGGKDHSISSTLNGPIPPLDSETARCAARHASRCIERVVRKEGKEPVLADVMSALDMLGIGKETW